MEHKCQTDKIKLRGMKFFAYHGVMPEENLLGQVFLVDLDLETSLYKAGESDQVEDTINYAEVYLSVKRIITEERHKLLERLAGRLAEEILSGFSCSGVRVEIHKPQAPIPGIFDNVSVEIYRVKEQ